MTEAAPATAYPRAGPTIRRTVLAAIGAIVVFRLSVPALPDYARRVGIDYSQAYGINHAALEGWSFGADILLTFGPLGWVLMPLDVGPHLELALAFRMMVLVAVGALVAATIVRIDPGWLAAPFVIMLVLAAPLTPELPLTFAVLLGLSVLADAPHRLALAAVFALFAAMALLIRFDLGVTCLGAVGAFTVVEWRDGRFSRSEAAVVAATPFAALAVLFPLVRGPLRDLPRFLYGYLEIVRGYGGAVKQAGPVLETVVSALAVTSVVVLAVIARSRALRRAAWMAVLPLAIAFKGDAEAAAATLRRAVTVGDGPAAAARSPVLRQIGSPG